MQGGPLTFSILVFLPIILFLFTPTQVFASPSPVPVSPEDSKPTYIVYTSNTPLSDAVKQTDSYIKSLIPILGSEKAAKEALVYSYKIIPAFAAKLTPDQASSLQKQPHIVYVIKSVKYELLDLEREGSHE